MTTKDFFKKGQSIVVLKDFQMEYDDTWIEAGKIFELTEDADYFLYGDYNTEDKYCLEIAEPYNNGGINWLTMDSVLPVVSVSSSKANAKVATKTTVNYEAGKVYPMDCNITHFVYVYNGRIFTNNEKVEKIEEIKEIEDDTTTENQYFIDIDNHGILYIEKENIKLDFGFQHLQVSKDYQSITLNFMTINNKQIELLGMDKIKLGCSTEIESSSVSILVNGSYDVETMESTPIVIRPTALQEFTITPEIDEHIVKFQVVITAFGHFEIEINK